MSWKSFISPSNWHYNFCMLIAFLIPLNKKYVPGFIGLYGIYAIFYSIRNRYFNKRLDWKLLVFPVALYAMMLVGFWWTSHPDIAAKELEYKLSMIVFPFLAWLTPQFTKEEVRKIIRAFVGGCLLFALIAISYGFYRAYHFEPSEFGPGAPVEYLTYSHLAIYFHPTYMAMYQALALFWLVSQGVKRTYILNRFYVHLFAVAIVLLFIVMLASKAGILGALLLMFWQILFVFKRQWNVRRGLMWGIATSVLLVALTLTLPLTSQRVDKAVSDVSAVERNAQTEDNSETPVVESRSSTALRKVTWSAAIAILLEKPTGTGIGNAQHYLDEQYKEMNEFFAAEKHLNAHNQFLQVGVELGLVGLLSFLIFMLISALRAYQSGSIFYQTFVGLVVLNFLFESVLEVQSGVVFFYFFLTVLSNSTLSKDSGV